MLIKNSTKKVINYNVGLLKNETGKSLQKYNFYSTKYKKYFVLMLFTGFKIILKT
jgi:hypothetical protein